MVRFFIRCEDGPGWIYDLPSHGSVSIGRTPGNDLVLDDPLVSRFHALLEIDGSEYLLVDLQGTNPTRVNGHAVERQLLVSGDILIIGRCRLRFETSGDEPSTALYNPMEGVRNSLGLDSDSSTFEPASRREPISGALAEAPSPTRSASRTAEPAPERDYGARPAPPSALPSPTAFNYESNVDPVFSASKTIALQAVADQAPPPESIAESFSSGQPGFERTQVRTPARQKMSWWKRLRNGAGAKSDLVDCSVFAPAAVRGFFLVQVYVHCPDQAGQAASLAQEFDAEAERRAKQTLASEIARGSRLSFHLSGQGLTVVEPVQQLIWRGAPEAVQFSAALASREVETAIGRVTVACDGVPLGHISFKVKNDGVRPHGAVLAGDHAAAYRNAFISYASKDRSEVLKRVQMLSNLGISYFQDVLSLEPGARWEKELYRHIDDSDLFLLFWSSAAKESKWVMDEVRYALKRKSGDHDAPPAIIPIIIEGPPPVDPPMELAHVHFNDYLTYFMDRH